MKVLYIFRSLAFWGGIERILVDKMNYLAKVYGYDVYMLTTDQGTHSVPYRLEAGIQLEDLGIRFHHQYRYRGLRRLWEARRLKRLYEQLLAQRLQTISPDVIVCTMTDHVDSLVRLKGTAPLVVESHSISIYTLRPFSYRQKFGVWQLKRSLRKVQAIVALTDKDAGHWRQLYQDKVRVIPNMIHLNPTGRISSQTSCRVIFVGRLDYQKMPLDAISIWQMVQPQFPDWELHIYGEGDQLPQVEEAISKAGCRIALHSPTSQIFDCYCDSCVLMSTSLFEPFGLVIPEAMSCGLPVVAYDASFGPSSIITDGVDGYIVEVGDVKQFANRLSALMADQALRQKMGAAAVRAAQRYLPENIMPQWQELFSNLTNKN